MSVINRQNSNFEIMQSSHYIVDLHKYDVNALMDVIDGCADVEKESWNAQENFYDYIQKCDGLGYAVLNNRIVGFTAGRAFYHGSICIYCSDETMVLRGFRKRNIGRNLLFAGMRWGLKSRSFEGIRHFGLLAISSNPRIINLFYTYSFLIKILFDCSFNASHKLIEALEAYRSHHQIALVHRDYPFCLKNMFPGSNTPLCQDSCRMI